jgi:arylsulfatase A-like enzyme
MPPVRSLLALPLLAACAAAPLAAADPPPGRRPNVVMIYVDDQSRDMVGCYGGQVPTPRIDALARAGVRCDGYYATSAVCSPSRYCLLTGRYPSRSANFLRVCPPGTAVSLGWQSSVVGERDTLPLALQAAGYRTAMVGKWHQDRDGVVQPLASGADPGDPAVRALIDRNYVAAVTCVQGCGFSFVGGLHWANIDGKGRNHWVPKAAQHHNPEWVMAEARRFLDAQAGSDQPFFLYVATTLPHWPPPLASLRDGDPLATVAGSLAAPPDAGMADRAAIRARLAAHHLPAAPDDRRKAGWQEAAAASVWIDEQVGSLLDRLDRHGLAGDTLVLYSSDNGFPPGKYTAYEEGSRLPLIARWPGRIPAGSVSRALIATADLAPTILAACGTGPASGAVVDGRDALPVLADGAPVQRWLYLENACTRAIVDDEGWKYIAVRFAAGIQRQADAGVRFNQSGQRLDGSDKHTFGGPECYPGYCDRDQLYRLDQDPSEQSNLAARPEHAQRLAILRQHLREVSRRLPHAFGEFTGDAAR